MWQSSNQSLTAHLAKPPSFVKTAVRPRSRSPPHPVEQVLALASHPRTYTRLPTPPPPFSHGGIGHRPLSRRPCSLSSALLLLSSPLRPPLLVDQLASFLLLLAFVVCGICLLGRGGDRLRRWYVVVVVARMGRGRVQLKRIENKINRQVTFSKRRSGLLKKAHEISVLCDAEVALIIFSTKGKLYEFSTDSRMERILERYERNSCAEREVVAADHESQESWCLEYAKLKAKVESLMKSQRHLMGEDLESLNPKDLQHLEQQLEVGLKQIRSRKNHLLFDSIAALQRKEKILQEQNSMLEKMLKEKEAAASLAQQARWEQQPQQNPGTAIGSSSPPTLALVDGGPATTLNIGTYQPPTEVEANQPQSRPSNKLPAWMVGHMNGN